MKKIISLALLASMVFSTNSLVFADEVPSVQNDQTETKATAWYSYKHAVNLVTEHPKVAAAVSITTVAVAAVVYCTPIRRMLGLEVEANKVARTPRLVNASEKAF